MTRRRFLPITAAGALAGLAAFALASGVEPERDELVLAAQTTEDVTCQVEPLAVSYRSHFVDGVYKVHTVNVSGIDPVHCDGAALSVTLTDGAAADPQVWSGAPVPITASDMTVALDADAPVEAVRRSNVRIVGGEVPVPSECTAQKEGNRTFGTPGDDTLAAPSRNSLVYGLGGDDVITGGSGADCLVGGSGDDRLFGESGRDVLVGGTGDDHLFGGPGADVLWAGEGVDTLDGGTGKDICHVEGDDDSTVGCEDVRRP